MDRQLVCRHWGRIFRVNSVLEIFFNIIGMKDPKVFYINSFLYPIIGSVLMICVSHISLKAWRTNSKGPLQFTVAGLTTMDKTIT